MVEVRPSSAEGGRGAECPNGQIPARKPEGEAPRRRTDLVQQVAGAETLLYDPATDTVHALNASAAAVWELCDARHSPAEMAQALQNAFAGTKGRDVFGDVRAVLAELRGAGLLQTSDRAC